MLTSSWTTKTKFEFELNTDSSFNRVGSLNLQASLTWLNPFTSVSPSESVNVASEYIWLANQRRFVHKFNQWPNKIKIFEIYMHIYNRNICFYFSSSNEIRSINSNSKWLFLLIRLSCKSEARLMHTRLRWLIFCVWSNHNSFISLLRSQMGSSPNLPIIVRERKKIIDDTFS